jgi:hypothetical protein
MRQKSGPEKQPAEDAIKDMRRAARRQVFGRGEDPRRAGREESIAELCRREGIASSMYYGWSKTCGRSHACRAWNCEDEDNESAPPEYRRRSVSHGAASRIIGRVLIRPLGTLAFPIDHDETFHQARLGQDPRRHIRPVH